MSWLGSTAYRELVTRSKTLFNRISVRRSDRLVETSLAEYLRRRPSPLISGPGRFGILWSGKSGSMAVTYWFLARVGLLEKAKEFHRNPHRYRLQVLTKSAQYRGWLATCDPRTMCWLRIIRCPYHRAVSSYRHVLGHGYEKPGIEGAHSSVPVHGLSFNEFLDHLLSIDIANCNVHYRQQWHPLEAHIEVLRFVNLDKEKLVPALEDFERLAGLAPLDSTTGASLLRALEQEGGRHHRPKVVQEGDCADTRFKQSDAKNLPGYGSFLRADTKEKIERIYANDFQAYGSFLSGSRG